MQICNINGEVFELVQPARTQTTKLRVRFKLNSRCFMGSLSLFTVIIMYRSQ